MDDYQANVRARTGLAALGLALLLFAAPVGVLLWSYRDHQESEVRRLEREAEEIRARGRRLANQINP